MTASTDALLALAMSLRGRASEAAVAEQGASFEVRLQDTLDLIRVGERAVAVENLVSNVHEYDIAIDLGERDVLRQLVEELPVNDSTLTSLRLLHTASKCRSSCRRRLAGRTFSGMAAVIVFRAAYKG